MSNIDFKKTLKHLYKPSAIEVSIVNIQPMNYLMIDGTGNPGTSERYGQAIEALYPLSYAIRAISKNANIVYTVMPLEGLWSFEGQEENIEFNLTEADKDTFVWTLMILQPEHITQEMVKTAREVVRKKKSPTLLDDVRFETYHEGEAVQIMHIGSYDDEGPNVKRLHNHIVENGRVIGKKHHEIYLSDPRKVASQKLKTIIRQPFERS